MVADSSFPSRQAGKLNLSDDNDPSANASQYNVAQYNIGRVHKPLEHPDMAEFTNNLEAINQLAEASPGFVWRLTDEEGNSSSFVIVDDNADPLSLVNMSVWDSVDALRHFIFKTSHVEFLRRRTTWFELAEQPTSICWWIPINTVPTVADAQRRLTSFINDGPSDKSWALAKPFSYPE